MILRDFLALLSLKVRVRYNVIDRLTKEVFDFPNCDLKKYCQLLDREIYMVSQSNDGTLEIHLY